MNNDFTLNGQVVMSVLNAFAIQSHELFMELKNAGFNEEQAIKILVGLVGKE